MNKKVLIVGAGLGGLSTALRLSQKGYDIKIIEKNSKAGGRLNQLKKDGFTFDIGPSFFSMSYEFKELAESCNMKMPFEYVEIDPLYTVNFRGNPKTYFLYKDIKKLAAQFKEEEPDFEEKMNAYLKECRKTFDDTINIVIKNNFDSLANYLFTLMSVNPGHLPKLTRTFWKQVNKYFDSQEAKQIVSLVAFFLGRTPFDTSAIYTLLSSVEFQHDGYYNVKGGMYKIIEGMVDELKNRNIEIIYNTEIVDFAQNDNKIESLTDKNGKKWTADAYLINADAAVFRNKILKKKKFSDQKLAKMNWTMGYLTFYIGLKCKLPQVNHHNYYIGTNYEEYANNILKNPGTLEKPYYYVNVLSRHNEECAPEGCESLFFVCPVPNLQYKKDWSDRDEIVNSILSDFSERIGQDIEKEIISKTIYTPVEWESKYNLQYGSGLGLAHDIMQIGAFRPKNYDEDYKNTFYVGASTIPGAGLPMAVISSKLAEERINKFLDK